MKRLTIRLFSLFLLPCTMQAQNTSYSANAVPVAGGYCTAFGVSVLHSNTGASNTATGYNSMYSNTTGISNTASGRASMFLNTTGNYNTANGYYALALNSTGSYNAAFGQQALYGNGTSTSYNSAFGYAALLNNTSLYNTAAGYQALYNNGGTQNTAVGSNALYANTSGSYGVAVGAYALAGNTTGWENTAVGYNALYYNTTGSNNTAFGYNALGSVPIGSGNTGIGAATVIGDGVNIYNNATVIGYGATASASNKVVIGNTSVTSIGGQVGWTIYSDARVKKNLKEDVPGLSFISLLKPVTYNYDIAKEKELLGVKNDDHDWPEKNNIEKMRFSGFVAQEVEAAAQKIGYEFSGVDKSGAIMGLRYSDFVVPLVKAVQEQQSQIDELKKIISSGAVTGPTMELSDKNAVALNQNAPNPFTKQTIIRYSVPIDATRAELLFYDAAGRLISSRNITDRGRGLITVDAKDLGSGVYSYTLVIDGKIEGSKQLIKQ